MGAQRCSEADRMKPGSVLVMFPFLAFADMRLRQAGCSLTPNLRGDFHGDIRTESQARGPAFEAQSRLYGHGDLYTCAFDRGKHRGIFGDECAVAEEPALFSTRTHGDDFHADHRCLSLR